MTNGWTADTGPLTAQHIHVVVINPLSGRAELDGINPRSGRAEWDPI